MDRFNTSAGAAAAPAAPVAPVNLYFTSGNPGLGVPATVPGPWWFHMLTEELRNLIVAAGLMPDHEDLSQVTQAIVALVQSASKAVILQNAVFEASVTNGEAVYWDAANSRFDEAIADGTVKQNAVGFADVTNAKVYSFGDAPLFTGLTPGAKYYLSGTVAGAITATVPTANVVQVGIAKTTTEVFVDIDATSNIGLATEATPGIVEKATTAEAQAFTADKYIDAALLNLALKGANQSLAASGYQKLPGGLILQWASQQTVTTTEATYSFPISFPTEALALLTSDSTTGTVHTIAGEIISASQYKLRNNTGTSQATIFAIGK